MYDIALNTWSNIISNSNYSVFLDWTVGRNGKLYFNDYVGRQIKSYDVSTKVISNLISYANLTIPANGGDEGYYQSCSCYQLKYQNFVNFFLNGVLLYKFNLDTNAWTDLGGSWKEPTRYSSDVSVPYGMNFGTNTTAIVTSSTGYEAGQSGKHGYLFNEYNNTKTTIFYEHEALPIPYNVLNGTPTFRQKIRSSGQSANMGLAPIDLGEGKMSYYNLDFNNREYLKQIVNISAFSYQRLYLYDYSEGYAYLVNDPNKTNSSPNNWYRVKVPVVNANNGYMYNTTWKVDYLLDAGIQIKLLQSVQEIVLNDWNVTQVTRPIGYVVTGDMHFDGAKTFKVELTLP